MTNNQRLVLSYFDEDPSRTLAEIGALVGVSKQAVSTTLHRFRPGWKEAHRIARSKPVITPEQHPCAVCGVPVRKTRRTCGGSCAKAWNSLRWHLDDEFRTAQRHRIANWMLAHPERVSKGSITWAKKVATEEGPAPPSKWVQEGRTPSQYVATIPELPGGTA